MHRLLFVSVLSVVIMVCVTGCSQTNQYEVQEEPGFTDLESFFLTQQNEAPNFGTLRLHCNGSDVSQAERTYTLEAVVYNEEHTNGERRAIDGGMATISNFELHSNADDPVVPNRYFAGISSINASQLPGFGQLTDWGLAGNPQLDIPEFSVQMYVPQEIDISTPAFVDPVNPNTISKSQPLQVTWNADPNNNWGVIIHLEYDKDYFNDDSNLPDAKQEFASLTPDDGSFSIDVADLTKFPANATIFLTLMRGNFSEPVINGKEFFLYAVSIDRGRLIVVD